MADIAPLAAQTLAQDTHLTSTPSTAPPTSADSPPKLAVGHDSIDDDDDDGDDDAASISPSLIDEPPASRLPTLPDLRFEQSYLASIAAAEGVWWKIALITLKDQCLMPMLQGVGYNLFVMGFRAWNRGAKFAGAGVGGEFILCFFTGAGCWGEGVGSG
ncbi:uncharacterized protein H6S33_012576 [Morchella sextelata]|uniref:uncharacterized protein n=1 Tax=Morchella sextelata TaxID=1174677 RepID=UPI001D056045|nr:uncharacterized protein H6S33_012576 [Morchella sextelata]KAH0610030.1 hypothetical protein H6S33_012576 [Morchella sextelata]